MPFLKRQYQPTKLHGIRAQSDVQNFTPRNNMTYNNITEINPMKTDFLIMLDYEVDFRCSLERLNFILDPSKF
jgi:hypothetical protein